MDVLDHVLVGYILFPALLIFAIVKFRKEGQHGYARVLTLFLIFYIILRTIIFILSL